MTSPSKDKRNVKHDSILSLAYAVLLLSVPDLSGVGAQQAAERGETGQAQITLDAVLAAASAEQPLVAAARARVDAAIGSRRTAGAIPNPVATIPPGKSKGWLSFAISCGKNSQQAFLASFGMATR